MISTKRITQHARRQPAGHRLWAITGAIPAILLSLPSTPVIAAGVIRSPVSASANVQPASPGDLQNAINQSCLSIPFTSGSTDFDAYLSQSPTHSVIYAGCEWFSTTGVTSANLIFDMGEVLTIDRLAMWNEESSGIAQFTISYSADGVAYSSVAGSFTPTNWPLPTSSNERYGANVFPLGVISARYIRLAITCPQSPSAYPGCSLGEIAFSTVAAAKIEITLLPSPASNKYIITNTPIMPAVKAKAKVVGVVPDPTSTTTFTWKSDLKTTKGTGETVSYGAYITQSQTTTGTGEYTLTFINPASILGGDLQITATANVNAKEVTGTTSPTLAIHGTNPQRTSIHSRVDAAVDVRSFSGLAGGDVKDTLKRMACQESTQKQFTGARDGGTGPVLVSFDNGVGIFQLTSGDPLATKPSIAFDWRSNVDDGASVFSSKVKVSKSYSASLRKNAAYKRFISETINQGRCMGGFQPVGLPAVPKNPADTYIDRCLASLTDIPTDAPAADFTASGLLGANVVDMLLEDGVRGYNGYGGNKLYGVALREFRPDSDFLLTLPDNSLPTLSTNTSIWQRVPVSERGTAGDPDYVGKVTLKQPTCP